MPASIRRKRQAVGNRQRLRQRLYYRSAHRRPHPAASPKQALESPGSFRTKAASCCGRRLSAIIPEILQVSGCSTGCLFIQGVPECRCDSSYPSLIFAHFLKFAFALENRNACKVFSLRLPVRMRCTISVGVDTFHADAFLCAWHKS